MLIKNVIFGMGGVIVNIDFNKMASAFKDLGVSNFHECYNQGWQATFIDDFETGLINEVEFRLAIRQAFNLGLTVTDLQIDDALNALFIDLPSERLNLIKDLRAEYRKILLFSNTNSIHRRRFTALCLEARREVSSFDDLFQPDQAFPGCFDREYYSYELHLKKPQPEAFQAILDENEFNACETVFIDDTEQHIRGAKEVGLHTIHLTADKSIMDVPRLIQELNAKLEEEKHENTISSVDEDQKIGASKPLPQLIEKKQSQNRSCCGFFSFLTTWGSKDNSKSDPAKSTYSTFNLGS